MSSTCEHGQLHYCEKCPDDRRREVPRVAREGALPAVFGDSAAQGEWLRDEVAVLKAISRGFGNIVDNARRISDEGSVPVRRKPKPEPQRMTFTRKGKKRKHKRR